MERQASAKYFTSTCSQAKKRYAKLLSKLRMSYQKLRALLNSWKNIHDDLKAA
jgi:hypothetical protein